MSQLLNWETVEIKQEDLNIFICGSEVLVLYRQLQIRLW